MKKITMALLSGFFAPTVVLASGNRLDTTEKVIANRLAIAQACAGFENSAKTNDESVYERERGWHVNLLSEYLNKFKKVEKAGSHEELYNTREALAATTQEYERLVSRVEEKAPDRGSDQMILTLVRANLQAMQEINQNPALFTVSLVNEKVDYHKNDRNFIPFPCLKAQSKVVPTN